MATHGLFEVFGVELEYMIVDRATMRVRPIADELLRDAGGSAEWVSDFDDLDAGAGGISWSNELTAHLIEIKTGRPEPTLAGLSDRFGRSVARINRLLAPRGCTLMPAAMHPLMDPAAEMKLWPHDNAEIYGLFNRIFDCRGHGWANLQSVHLNLPFKNDDEFGRLHAAIRLVLPILPAIAASSPIVEGRVTGTLDNRLAVYRTNARNVPICSGRVIPEPVFTKADYEREILARIYRDLEPHDPDGVLRHEWANSRGAIARFERNAIEIRVLDVQEYPAADLAICAAAVGLVRELVGERFTTAAQQRSWAVEPLFEVLLAAIERGERAVVTNADYLRALGVTPAPGGTTLQNVWRQLIDRQRKADPASAPLLAPMDTILDQGPLARRILARVGNPDGEPGTPDRERVLAVCRELSACLAEGRALRAPG